MLLDITDSHGIWRNMYEKMARQRSEPILISKVSQGSKDPLEAFRVPKPIAAPIGFPTFLEPFLFS